MEEFDWKEAKYPCLGISDNETIVCFSSYKVGHNIKNLYCSDNWIMDLFKPYETPKERVKLWYWESQDDKGDWSMTLYRKSEEEMKISRNKNYRKLSALGFI